MTEARTRPARRGPSWLRPPDWLARIDRAGLRADLLAGLTGATIVLPQAVAFWPLPGCRRNTGSTPPSSRPWWRR